MFQSVFDSQGHAGFGAPLWMCCTCIGQYEKSEPIVVSGRIDRRLCAVV